MVEARVRYMGAGVEQLGQKTNCRRNGAHPLFMAATPLYRRAVRCVTKRPNSLPVLRSLFKSPPNTVASSSSPYGVGPRVTKELRQSRRNYTELHLFINKTGHKEVVTVYDSVAYINWTNILYPALNFIVLYLLQCVGLIIITHWPVMKRLSVCLIHVLRKYTYYILCKYLSGVLTYLTFSSILLIFRTSRPLSSFLPKNVII